ncbi:MAG: TonB-dependent siderophore receptor [Allorhizobium sp.]
MVRFGSALWRHKLALMAGASLALHAGIVFAQEPQTELETIVLESESDAILVQEGYVGKTDRIGTKTDTPLVEIPQSVSVVTQDQIEDQRPRTLNEALTYTAGANPNTFGFDTRYDAFYLRGFPAYYNGMFRDGLRQFNGPSAWLRTEPYGLEGVTVLKGPASSLYGVSGPGGIVNMVTKRPKDETFREIEVGIGQDSRYQAGIDLSGPVSEVDSVLYRFTAMGRKSDTELEGYPDDKLYLAPAFTWKPDEDTKFTILSEYSKARVGGTAFFYQPFYGEVTDIYGGDPEWNKFDQTQGRIGYEFEHRLNDVVTLRQNLRYSAVDADLEYSGLYGATPTRYWGYYEEDMKNFAVDNMAQFEFDTGSVSHTAVAGVDYNWSDYAAYSAVSYTTRADLEVDNPPFSGSQESNMVGVYVHDQMEWDNLTLFTSARYDWVKTDAVDSSYLETEQKDRGLSGRIGLSYRTEVGLIPYASYSTSFSPNVGFVYDDPSTSDSRVADPTIGKQKEIGIKYEVPGANAVLSAALFDIDQQDGVVFDTSSGINKQVQRDLNSRGVELEANASFDNGFSLIASYTYMLMKIDKGAAGTEGNELSGTPNHIASLWGHYLVETGPLQGLGLGAGLRYAGNSYGDDNNSFENDSRVFADAALSYDFGYRNPNLQGLTLQVNAKNLFDTQKPICSAGSCYWDEGRTIYGSLRYRF